MGIVESFPAAILETRASIGKKTGASLTWKTRGSIPGLEGGAFVGTH